MTSAGRSVPISGKSTGIPLVCLDAGRAAKRRIVCTQPRRIAAVSLASRLSSLLHSVPGRLVGYRVRFEKKTCGDTVLEYVTDGWLNAFMNTDPLLKLYDTLIIDEVHERSLNIDLLLARIDRVLLQRPEFRLILSSATLDADTLRGHFPLSVPAEDGAQNFPADQYYRTNLSERTEEEQAQDELPGRIAALAEELCQREPGDILVFLSGRREIEEIAEKLRGRAVDAEILMLYAEMSAGAYDRAFAPAKQRKIILATNVAETSLTIPGIRYVIDSGRVKISRFNPRTSVRSLQEEPTAQDAAEQRKGRCGRTAPGILYTRTDYNTRAERTLPQILREDLSELILRLKSSGLYLPDLRFPDPPEPDKIRGALKLLTELGALDNSHRLTPDGREMARQPLHPRTARIILTAVRRRCLYDAVIAVAGAGRELHPAVQLLISPDSDLLTLINLHRFYREQNPAGSSRSRIRRFCREHGLSYKRISIWLDTADDILRNLPPGTPPPRPPDNTDSHALHLSFLSGFLHHIGQFDRGKNAYRTVGGRTFRLFPKPIFCRKKSQWLLAPDMFETGDLFAAWHAKITPAQIEEAGNAHLKRSYGDAYWDRESATVKTDETVTLFGLPLFVRRPVLYGRINREKANAVFIRQALIENNFDCPFPFLTHNKTVRALAEEYAVRRRRTDISDNDEALTAFYTARVQGVASMRDFQKLINAKNGDRFLYLTPADIIPPEFMDTEILFPSKLTLADTDCPIRYTFKEGTEDDGAHIRIPLSVFRRLDAHRLEYGLPGTIDAKTAALFRRLPRDIRRRLIPIEENAAKAAAILKHFFEAGKSGACVPPETGEFYASLSRITEAETGVTVPPEAWQTDAVPPHLQLYITVTDARGTEIYTGRNIKEMSRAVAHRLSPVSGNPTASAGRTSYLKLLADEEFSELQFYRTVPAGIRSDYPINAYTGLLYDAAASCLYEVHFLNRREAFTTTFGTSLEIYTCTVSCGGIFQLLKSNNPDNTCPDADSAVQEWLKKLTARTLLSHPAMHRQTGAKTMQAAEEIQRAFCLELSLLNKGFTGIAESLTLIRKDFGKVPPAGDRSDEAELARECDSLFRRFLHAELLPEAILRLPVYAECLRARKNMLKTSPVIYRNACREAYLPNLFPPLTASLDILFSGGTKNFLFAQSLKSVSTPFPHDSVAKGFILSAVVWGIAGMLIGVWIAFALVFPNITGDLRWLTFNRLRPLHTNGVIYGFVLSTIFAAWYYMSQRLRKTASGFIQPRHSAGGYLPAFGAGDLISSRCVLPGGKKHSMFPSGVSMLYLFNNFAIPTYLITGTGKWTHAVSAYAGSNDANVQWWWGHNAVGFVLTVPIIAMAYYAIPKQSNQPTLGMIFSLILILPSWGSMINLLLTVSGKWEQLKTDPILKFLVIGSTFYGLATLEGPIQAIKSVNALAHFTDWIVGHVHSGALGWVGFTCMGTIISSCRACGTVRCILKKSRPRNSGCKHSALCFTGLMWRATDQYGSLAYSFLDTVIALKPYWILRGVGGTIYLIGFFMFGYNLIRTIQGTPVKTGAVNPVPAA
ncbi:hypothetical protein CHS0354_018385 [Potamilus streckersoni]|uniref:RNA helicase n=1 Tax=Potamilus streckersoni TaxID=2493646 RepID=A0AAE0TAT2_9BIVA|nr:hypothetical protein CHS0354_018385 [Potamilus streckersoni]